MKRLLSIRKSARGQSFVELAITLPLLLIILTGAIDFGWAMWTYSALTIAAEEGASVAQFMPAETAKIINRVRNTSNSPVNLADTATVQVSVVNLSAVPKYCKGEKIRVTVTTQHKLVTPFIGALIGAQEIPLSATHTALVVKPACSP